MPSVYCTQCGHANPEDARFCSRCGSPPTKAETPGDAHRRSPSPGSRPTRRRQVSPPVRRPDRPSSSCPRAPRCWSSSAAPTPAAGSCSTSDRHHAGRHPDSDIFLDDVTVSRRHAEFTARRTAASPSGRRQPERHLRQPGAHRARPRSHDGDEVQIGKFRLVFLTQLRRQAAVTARRPRARIMSIGEVLGQLRRRVPRRHASPRSVSWRPRA